MVTSIFDTNLTGNGTTNVGLTFSVGDTTLQFAMSIEQDN